MSREINEKFNKDQRSITAIGATKEKLPWAINKATQIATTAKLMVSR